MSFPILFPCKYLKMGPSFKVAKRLLKPCCTTCPHVLIFLCFCSDTDLNLNQISEPITQWLHWVTYVKIISKLLPWSGLEQPRCQGMTFQQCSPPSLSSFKNLGPVHKCSPHIPYPHSCWHICCLSQPKALKSISAEQLARQVWCYTLWKGLDPSFLWTTLLVFKQRDVSL